MTRKRLLFAGLAALVGLASLTLGGCGADRGLGPDSPDPSDSPDAASRFARPIAAGPFGKMVIANRGSGTISVLDARDGTSLGTYDLPAGPSFPEPMYVVYVKRTNRVVVGDRANSRVVEFDAKTYDVMRTADTGAGVFHMWVDPVQNRQLWVNNDVDNTATVIDPVTFTTRMTVPMPADLVAAGYKPHDVVLDPLGDNAYVSLVGPGANDWIVGFETGGFTETARAAVGKDPHVSLTRRNDRLYVPCQNSDVVIVLDRDDLSPVTSIAVPGAHGAGMTQSGRIFYTANLPGGGTDALFAIDTRTNSVSGEAADAPFAVPHNIAVTNNGRRLFLTHSGGSADKVSFYAISPAHPTPVLLGDVTVGLNPFGLAYAP